MYFCNILKIYSYIQVYNWRKLRITNFLITCQFYFQIFCKVILVRVVPMRIFWISTEVTQDVVLNYCWFSSSFVLSKMKTLSFFSHSHTFFSLDYLSNHVWQNISFFNKQSIVGLQNNNYFSHLCSLFLSCNLYTLKLVYPTGNTMHIYLLKIISGSFRPIVLYFDSTLPYATAMFLCR